MTTKFVNVLLADDDADDRLFFRDATSALPGVFLTEAFDGEDALLKLSENSSNPDFIVLDINMPRLGGLDCLRKLRAHPRFATLPVVIMSTANDYRVIAEARKAGANFYAIKPGSFSILQRMVTFLTEQDWNEHIVNPEEFLLNTLIEQQGVRKVS